MNGTYIIHFHGNMPGETKHVFGACNLPGLSHYEERLQAMELGIPMTIQAYPGKNLIPAMEVLDPKHWCHVCANNLDLPTKASAYKNRA